MNESSQILILWSEGQDTTYLWNPSYPLKSTYLSHSLVFLFHKYISNVLMPKNTKIIQRRMSKGLEKSHWWIWGLYPPPSSFCMHPIRSENWEKSEKIPLNFALPELSIIKYGDRGRRGHWWWWKVCFYHYLNINTSFSSLIHQEGIFQHIKFNFKKKKKWADTVKYTWPKPIVGFPSCPF